jgi:hypothetical protein
LGVTWRVADSGGVDSMLRFQLKMRDDGTKRCRKIKRRQCDHIGYIERKRDIALQNDEVGWRRCTTEEEKGTRQRQLD